MKNRYERLDLEEMRDDDEIRADWYAVDDELLKRVPQLRRALRRTEAAAEQFGRHSWQYLRQIERLGDARRKAWAAHPDLKARWDDFGDEFLARCEAEVNQPR
jgi:hypothetical protein